VYRSTTRGEVYAYRLSDEGRLLAHLTSSETDNRDETRWYVTQLRLAVEAWSDRVPQATPVVIRSINDEWLLSPALRKPGSCGDAGRFDERV
jgi:hypothetical protein